MMASAARASAVLLLAALLAGCASPPSASGFPRAMILPQPDDQLSFQVDGREWLRYHYGDRSPKPDRADPDLVGAADAVAVVVGEVHPHLQRQRHQQR